MAKERKSVNIGIKFPSKNEANKQLTDLLDQVSKLNKGFKLELDTTNVNKTLKEFSALLDRVHEQLVKFDTNGDIFKNTNRDTEEAIKQQTKYQKVLGKSLNIGDGSKGFGELQARAKEIRNTVDELAKISFNTSKNGALKDASITYVDNMGKVVTETMKWKTVATDTEGVMKRVFTTTNVAVSDNVQQMAKLAEQVVNTKNKLQGKINIAKNNDFIDVSVIDDLQSKLNSISTITPKNEIKELETVINNLSSSDKSVVRVQSAISRMENSLTALKTKYGSLVGDSSSINQLEQYERELSNLRNILNELTNGKTFSGEKLSSEINKGTDAGKRLANSVKDSSEALKLATKDATTFTSAFKSMMTKVGLASASYMILNKLKQSLRDGIEAVKEMDSAITTLRITMDGMTKSSLNSMVLQSQQLATNLSSTTTKVLEAVKTFANASETIDSIMAKTSSAIILSNLTGLDTQTTVDTIQSATQQFEELSDGSEKSAMKVTDSMVAISRALGMDFSKGIREMSESIGILGSLSQQLGGDLDQTLALIAGGMGKLRLSGTEIATSMKTIMVRTQRVSGEGVSEEDFKNAEKALNNIGIKIRDLNTGKMQPFMETMQQVSAKWDTMSESAQLSLGEQLGGVRQLSQVLATIKNMPRIDKLTDIGRNSEGEGLKAQTIWAESLEARLQSLTNSTQIFWQNFIDGDMLKNGVTLLDNLLKTLTKLQDVFGSLGLSVAIVTSGFLMFTNNPLKNLSQAMAKNNVEWVGFKKGMIEVTDETGVASKGFTSLGFTLDATRIKAIALQSVMSLGLSLAVTLAVKAVTWFIDKATEADATMESCTTQAKALSDALNDINGEKTSIDRYGEINEELKKANLEEEKRKALIQESNDIKSNLSSLESEYFYILNNNKLTEEKKLELLQQQYDEKLKQKALDLEESMMAQDKIENKKREMEMYADQYLRLQNAINNQDSNGVTQWNGQDVGATALVKQQEQIAKAMNEDKTEIDSYNTSMDFLIQANAQGGRSIVELNSNVDEAMRLMDDSTESINNNTKAKQENSNSNYQPMSQEEATTNIQEATKLYGQATDKANELREMISQINEEGTVTPELISKLAENYSELGFKINDAGEVQDFLNQKLQEQITASQDAYSTMLANDSEFYQAKIANNEEFQNSLNSVLSQMVSDNNEFYGIDLSNYANLQDLKNALNNQFGDSTSQFLNNLLGIYSSAYTFDSSQYADLQSMKEGYLNQTLGAVENWIGKYTGSMAKSYGHDLNQFQSLAEAKSAILAQLNSKLKVLQSNYENMFNSIQKASGDDPTVTMNHALHYTKTQINEITTAIGVADKVFGGLETTLNGYTSSFNGANFKGTGVGSKGSGGSSGKSDAEKEAEERIKAEEEANKRILQLRTELVNALKKKYEEEKNSAISAIDKEIDELQKKLDKLENGYVDEKENLKQQEEMLKLWEQDDSAEGVRQANKLRENIEKIKLKIEIDAKEEQKSLIEKKYDELLDEQRLIIDRISRNRYRTQL